MKIFDPVNKKWLDVKRSPGKKIILKYLTKRGDITLWGGSNSNNNYFNEYFTPGTSPDISPASTPVTPFTPRNFARRQENPSTECERCKERLRFEKLMHNLVVSDGMNKNFGKYAKDGFINFEKFKEMITHVANKIRFPVRFPEERKTEPKYKLSIFEGMETEKTIFDNFSDKRGMDLRNFRNFWNFVYSESLSKNRKCGGCSRDNNLSRTVTPPPLPTVLNSKHKVSPSPAFSHKIRIGNGGWKNEHGMETNKPYRGLNPRPFVPNLTPPPRVPSYLSF